MPYHKPRGAKVSCILWQRHQDTEAQIFLSTGGIAQQQIHSSLETTNQNTKAVAARQAGKGNWVTKGSNEGQVLWAQQSLTEKFCPRALCGYASVVLLLLRLKKVKQRSTEKTKKILMSTTVLQMQDDPLNTIWTSLWHPPTLWTVA